MDLIQEYKITEFLEKSYARRRLFDKFMCFLCLVAALLAIAPLISIFGYILIKGFPFLYLGFFTNLPAPVGEAGGGMGNALLGTGILVLLASSIGIPWGIATGVYLSEYGRTKIDDTIRFASDLLASIPSIVIGIFVYTIVVMPFKRFSAIAGGIALGMIMIPIVAKTTEELLKLVPIHIREAGLALGLPRWKVITFIVLKGSFRGVLTGVMLSIARVAGETAPLLFTAFNNRFWNVKLTEPISSLPVQIYSYAISPFDDWHGQAWAGALVLVFLVFLINVTTRFMLKPQGRIS
jgi:phosphate transport system permease protein